MREPARRRLKIKAPRILSRALAPSDATPAIFSVPSLPGDLLSSSPCILPGLPPQERRNAGTNERTASNLFFLFFFVPFFFLFQLSVSIRSSVCSIDRSNRPRSFGSAITSATCHRWTIKDGAARAHHGVDPTSWIAYEQASRGFHVTTDHRLDTVVTETSSRNVETLAHTDRSRSPVHRALSRASRSG